MLEELCKRIQHRCPTLRRLRKKRNVGSCWLKSLTGFNFEQQHETTSNSIQQRVQTDVTCNVQQCCVCLHGALERREWDNEASKKRRMKKRRKAELKQGKHCLDRVVKSHNETWLLGSSINLHHSLLSLPDSVIPR